MTNVIVRGAALARAAEAMLRALGGGEVTLRCPAAAAPDETAGELGRAAPLTADFTIAPVVARSSGDAVELLMAPSAVAQYMQERGQSAEQFFQSVLAVFAGGREYKLRLFHVEQFAGDAYLYRVSVTTKS